MIDGVCRIKLHGGGFLKDVLICQIRSASNLKDIIELFEESWSVSATLYAKPLERFPVPRLVSSDC